MKRHIIRAAAASFCLLNVLTAAITQASASDRAKCVGTPSAGTEQPSPADPYPLMAAGWGPELGNGLMASRWAEDWTGLRSAGTAPAGKAIPLGDEAILTLSAEARWRVDSTDNGRAVSGNDFTQGLFRGIAGADLRLNSHVRFYGEVGTGQVDGRRQAATANFQNDVALQQLFVEYRRTTAREWLVGGLAGRQEFSDGPRQLNSLSDGPNLHRTWNGVRLYAHGERARFGLFDFRVTRLGVGAFDETINSSERLRGANASFVVSAPGGPNTYLDPFWYQTRNNSVRVGELVGADRRDTVGARLWGRKGALRFDWTATRQTGQWSGRPVDAWAVFAVQSVELSSHSWKPRLSSRIDVASGGSAFGSGPVRTFNPLYASSNYVGEGQFFSLSNIALATAGVSVTPTPRSALALEYSAARRLHADDALYAGGMRPYAGTESLPSHDAGRLVRFTGSWTPSAHWTLALDYERLAAGELLRTAGFHSSGYAYLSATFRY